MPTSWRLVRPVILFALIAAMLLPLGLSPAAAQDGEGEDAPVPVVIQGSDALEDVMIALRDAYVAQNPDAVVEIDPRGGQSTAFEALCSGDVDVVMSTDAISDAQIEACTASGQTFVETVLAYEAIVLLAPAGAGLSCVDAQAVNDAWAFGAETEMNWAALGGTDLENPITFYGPDAVYPAAVLFAGLIPGGKLRDDITVIDDPAELAAKVLEEGSSAFGYMTLADFNALEDVSGLTPLQISTETDECVDAGSNTIGLGIYPLSRIDYLYVNGESAATPDVQTFMQFVLQDEGGISALAAEQGYTLADSGSYGFGINNILSANTGRTFTRPASPVAIDSTATGTLNIAGTVMLADVTDTLVSDFSTEFSLAEVNVNYTGNTAGWEAFCTGAADVLQTTAAPTDEQLALCAENGVDPYELDLGYDAQVIAVPSSNDWLECMDSATASAMFSAGSADSPAAATWADVNPAWPDEALLLVAPTMRLGETDFFVYNVIGELSFLLRQDLTTSSDPSYRAQGVANTTNGLTFLWWSDLQGIEADVRLVPVEGADGCVAPDAETIADGSYSLAFPLRYYVNRGAFDNALVRAFLWQMFSDSALDEYAALGSLGLDIDVLTFEQRELVYDLLAAYEIDPEAAAEMDVEPTAEPTVEPTAEPTVEPTVEPTEEPTVAPTEEPTEEPTVAPTEEPTEEPTVAPTEEPTEEPTVAPTEEPTEEPTVVPTAVPTKGSGS